MTCLLTINHMLCGICKMNSDSKKKYKKPKSNTSATTNPSTSSPRIERNDLSNIPPEPLCPLLAKDSEWVDILQTPQADTAKSATNVSDEEDVLQLVECENGPQMKPLAIMFPGLLDKDPHTLQGMLNKAMSTTEVTRHLVDLGQKANFTFMKKADRLIPPQKQWMESLTENSNSYGSVNSEPLSNCISSDYEDDKISETLVQGKIRKKKHFGSEKYSIINVTQNERMEEPLDHTQMAEITSPDNSETSKHPTDETNYDGK